MKARKTKAQRDGLTFAFPGPALHALSHESTQPKIIVQDFHLHMIQQHLGTGKKKNWSASMASVLEVMPRLTHLNWVPSDPEAMGSRK